jgi:arylsulfatase
VTQQPIEGTSMSYTLDDAAAPDRHRTQYFEMCGNRGIFHEGWMAVTRHGIPWQMIPDGKSFAEDTWELYHLDDDWSQANDLAEVYPDKLRELRELFLIEAAKHQVFPLDDRVTERENPEIAGRIAPGEERESATYSGGMRRLTEETTPNVKNTSHRITADVELTGKETHGVVVAQGGRFGGWSLYFVDACPSYVYNYFGMRRYTVRAGSPVGHGRHQVALDFDYDGPGIGKGGTATLTVDGEPVASGWVEQTIPYYFSFDETLDVGVDLSTPVTDDYPAIDNEFTGQVRSVRIEVSRGGDNPDVSEGLRRRILGAH